MGEAFGTGGENLPRLAAVVERQRRELAALRAETRVAVVVAMARGVLMERYQWTAGEAARQLADMAAAAGLPEAEMAAAVLSQEPPPRPDEPAAGEAGKEHGDGEREVADPTPGEWLAAGRALGPADDVVAIAAAERAKDGAELVGVLAAQLRTRFGATAVAVWLLDADGALELLGQDGLGGTESSRWRRLPPQFDCLEQRVIATGADLWLPAGPKAGDPVPAAAPWGRGAARATLALRDRPGMLLGVVEAWWPTRRTVFDVSVRSGAAAVLSGFADVLALRLAYGPVGSTAPSPAVFLGLDQISESALVVRPLRGADGSVTDFRVVHMSPGYVDPAGREAATLAGLTLLEAYPSSVTGDGLFAMAERVLRSGRAEHVPEAVAAALTGDTDAVQVAGLHAVPFFAGVLFAWRTPGAAERHADLLGQAQRLGPHRRLGGGPRDGSRPLDAGHVRPVRARSRACGADSDRQPAQLRDRRGPRAGPRFRQALLNRREAAVAVFRIVRPGDSAVRQIRIFAEPVLAGDDVVGLRGAFQDVSAHYHTQVALAATQDQLADSEQRADEEQQLALRLQRAIMPEDEPPVEAAGVDVAVRYRPAEQGRLVAGDWYDALLLPDKRTTARGRRHHRARHRRGHRHDRRAQRAARPRGDRRGPRRPAQAPQLRGLSPDRGHRGHRGLRPLRSRRPACCTGPGPGTCRRSWSGTARPRCFRCPAASCSASTPTPNTRRPPSTCAAATPCCCSPTA